MGLATKFTFRCFRILQRHEDMPERSWCFLYYNDTIVQQPIFLNNLSSGILHDAKSFLKTSLRGDQPFFLYVSLPQTHAPMYNRPDFAGKSKRGEHYTIPSL